MGGSTYDYGLRETTYLDKIKSPRTTHEGGADIKYGRFLDELGWEFNQEGRRRQDLIRLEYGQLNHGFLILLQMI